MIKVSDWYNDFADVTFPTMFVRLSDAEKEALVNNREGEGKERLWSRLANALGAIHGGAVINADCCAPTDSAAFRRRRIVHTPISSWKQLTTSEKVIEALKLGRTDRLVLRPYRRMDRSREFRLFIKGGALFAASQYDLKKNYPRLAKRQEQIWSSLNCFFNRSIRPFLSFDNVVIDVYMCGNGQILIVDFNEWGGETAPLLLRSWSQDLEMFMKERHPLMLLAAPVKMTGDISVSF